MSKTQLDLMVPIPVRRALRKLGQDIRDAKLRRRIPTAVMAERASISRTTLNKIERVILAFRSVTTPMCSLFWVWRNDWATWRMSGRMWWVWSWKRNACRNVSASRAGLDRRVRPVYQNWSAGCATPKSNRKFVLSRFYSSSFLPTSFPEDPKLLKLLPPLPIDAGN